MQIAQTKTRGGDLAAEAKDSAARDPFASSGDASRIPGYAAGQDARPAVPLFQGFGASLLQTKLAVGEPDDPFEREADAVAELVASGREGSGTPPSITPVTPQALAQQAAEETDEIDEPATQPLQKMPDEEEAEEEEEEELRAETVLDTGGGGEPLDEETRERVEGRMGQDFSDVRVHDDARAAEANEALGARAFTSGSDIFLGEGESKEDEKLIAHELTHVVQQGGVARRPPAEAEDATAAPSTSTESTPEPFKPEPVTPEPAVTVPAVAATITSTPASTTPAPSTSMGTVGIQPKAATTTTAGPAPVTAGTPTPTAGASTPTFTAGAPEKPAVSTAQPTPAATTPTSAADAGKQAADAGGAGGAGGGGDAAAALLGSGGGGGGGGGGGATAAEPVAPEIDASSSEALLASLAAVPASGFAAAVNMATEAAPGIQEQEKSDLAAEFPEIERPTGLPSRPLPVIAPPDLGTEEGEQPEIEGEQQGEPFDTEHEAGLGPVPEGGPTPRIDEPTAEEDEGSWWDRFFSKLTSFLGGLPTSDPNVNTSAGERPKVDLTGDADPAQNDRSLEDGRSQVDAGRADADAATYEYFGEDDIYPDVPRETLRPAYTPGAPPAGLGGLGATPGAVPADALAAFDAGAAPHIEEEVQAQRDEYDAAKVDYEQQSEETRAEGQRRIEEENERIRAEQEGVQVEAKGLINDERERWREENSKLVEDFESQSEAKREETNQQIDDEVEAAEEEADQKMTEAEHEAEEEKRKAEEAAAEEKRKAEQKPRSWWDDVVDAIDAVFDAIKAAVNAIFDALRWAVKQIIEGVKWLVNRLIEAVALVIIGLIYVFAEFVKGLVDIALFAFPEKRKAAREWIDGTRDSAIRTVIDAAEALKAATNAILDWVAEGLDKLLAGLQALYNFALNVLHLLATGRLAELLQHLEDLGQAMWDGLGLIEGEIWKELIGFDLTKDLGPQMAGDDKEQAKKMAEEEGGDADNIAFLLQETITEDQVAVEELTELELDDELVDALTGGEGAESAVSEGAGTGTDAIMADLLESLPQEQLPAEAEQAEAEAAQIDPQTQALMERMATAKTRSERLDIVKDLVLMALNKFWEEKLKPNLWWIIPAVIVAIAAFIALEIFTAGAITAAIPVVLEVVAAIFLAHDIARVTGALGAYLEKGWAGDVPGAAEAFAKAIAIGIVAVIMLLLFEVGGAAIKAAFKGVARGVKAGVKAAATAAKAVARGVVKGVLYIGKLAVKVAKIGATLTGRSGKFVLRKGKLFFKAVSKTFAKGVKSVDEFFQKLKEFYGKFKGFKLRRGGKTYFILYAVFNPEVPVAIVPEKTGISAERYKELRKKTPSDAIRKMVNDVPPPKRDPVYGDIVDTLEADHIVPMKQIVNMPGFNKLPMEKQVEVLNLSDNFMGLGKQSNASKGAKSYSEWIGHSKKGEIPPAVKQQLLQREKEALEAIKKAIDARLPAP